MDEEKDKLSIEVAELYYQLNYSQQQIANQLEISRPTVSRLLQYAKEKGYIKIAGTQVSITKKGLKEFQKPTHEWDF